MKPDDSPAAIVSQKADLRILCNEALALNKAINRRRKENLQDRYELGKRLARIKDEIGHGKWLPWLEENGLSQSYVKRCVTLAKSPPGGDLESEWQRLRGETTDDKEPTSVKPPDAPPPPKPPNSAPSPNGSPAAKGGGTNAAPSAGPSVESGALTTAPEVVPAPLLDEESHIVPERLIPTFTDAAKFGDVSSLLGKAQSDIDALAQSSAGGQLRFRLNAERSGDRTILKSQHISEAKRDVKFTRPHSVCPWCAGLGDGCDKCSGLGWVSKLTWKDAPEDIKGRIPCTS